MDCLNDAPEGLPFLLHCVEWNNRDEVSEICSLLKQWPTLPVERSLELLDYAYPDPTVRSFAIRCLRELRYVEIQEKKMPISIFILINFPHFFLFQF